MFYSKTPTQRAELIEIIEDRIEFMQNAFKRRSNFVIQPEGEEKAKMAIHSLEVYGLIESEFNHARIRDV